MNPSKPYSSTMSVKSKKQLKMKGKCPPQVQTCSNSSGSNSASNDVNEKDKGSPSKDFQDYAGISSDSISIYAEQTSYEHLSEEVCNILAEDINYKLRYIIHNSLIKAKLQGREVVTSDDIDETFSNLKIDKVYGASPNPNWLPFGDNTLYHLDDQKVNLIEVAEEETSYAQEGDIILEQVWLPDENDSEEELEEYNEILTEYFEGMCEAIISNDEEIRNMALKDISENSSIGPITDWFYHFSYFLLMKDITYDCLTLRALQLLEVLENSPLPSLHIYGKQLKLLVRLLLQRLLISVTTDEVLKPMCYVLSLLCLRTPLKRMVLSKIEDKIMSVCQDMAVPLLNIIYFLGIDAVTQIFLPNMNYFLTRILQEDNPDLREIVLSIYGLICKANLNEGFIYSCFNEVFSTILVPFWVPKRIKAGIEKQEIDFVNMKKQLVKTRRKVDYRVRPNHKKTHRLEDVFDIPIHDCTVTKNLTIHRNLILAISSKKETHVTIGKTSLLLSVLKCKKRYERCTDHSLLAYNL